METYSDLTSRALALLMDSGTGCFTSNPSIEDQWGQLPASHHNLYMDGETMRGYLICDPEVVYVCSIGMGTMVEIDSALRPDQSWFWSASWQALESEAEKNLAAGEFDDFDSLDDLIKDLESRMSDG